MNDSTEIARINRLAIGPARFLRNVIEINTVDQAMEIAKMMAIAKQAVPKHLRNEPGMCLAVILQAKEWEMAPYAVARKSYVVNDTLAYESQLIHAVIEARAPIKTRLNCRYEGEGPTRQCIVVGTFQGDTEPRDYTSPQIKDIKPKNSPLWTSDPDQQLFYYSSRAWCRKWCPDVLLGVYAPDELAPGSEGARDVTPVIHNPLQDDAEVAGDGREPGDEMPPKRVDVLEGQAARDALTRPEPNDGAHVHDNGTVTRPGDVGHPKQTAATKVKGCDQDQEKSCQEPFSWNDGVPYCDSCGLYRSARHHPPEAPLGGKVGSQVDEFDEPVAETPAKPARRPPQDAPKPEVAPVTPQAEKSSPAPNGGAPDWRKLRPAALAKLSGADYLAYLAKWTAEMVAAGGVAEALRIRFSVDERDVRNRLGSMLDQDQLAEAKRIATEAFKELGGMS